MTDADASADEKVQLACLKVAAYLGSVQSDWCSAVVWLDDQRLKDAFKTVWLVHPRLRREREANFETMARNMKVVRVTQDGAKRPFENVIINSELFGRHALPVKVTDLEGMLAAKSVGEASNFLSEVKTEGQATSAASSEPLCSCKLVKSPLRRQKTNFGQWSTDGALKHEAYAFDSAVKTMHDRSGWVRVQLNDAANSVVNEWQLIAADVLEIVIAHHTAELYYQPGSFQMLWHKHDKTQKFHVVDKVGVCGDQLLDCMARQKHPFYTRSLDQKDQQVLGYVRRLIHHLAPPKNYFERVFPLLAMYGEHSVAVKPTRHNVD